MNRTAELILHWAEFEEKHPESDINEFCLYYLASHREKANHGNLFDGELPPRTDIIMTKLLDRISRFHMFYVHMALKDMKINHFEEFSLLSAIYNLKTPRKTEVIYHTINELSTGLNLLEGMKKQGYIVEWDDPDDKRSKRLKLTSEGKKVLQACYEKFSKIPEMLFMDMPKDDIELCVQLLKSIDIKFSGLWQQHKGKSFDLIYYSITGKTI
jgi:DNA-binding MarR family transcriptional regulator